MKLWDTWYLNHQGEVHAFYMQGLAPHSHRSAQEAGGIGHAVSRNLLDWKELPVALLPGEAGSGEDLNIFTGCAAEKDGVLYLYYTQRASEDEGRTQQIGLATSRDFLHFEKYAGEPHYHAGPVLSLHPGGPGPLRHRGLPGLGGGPRPPGFRLCRLLCQPPPLGRNAGGAR